MNGSRIESCAEKPAPGVAPIVGLFLVFLTVGCAGVEDVGPSGLPQTGAAPGKASAVEPEGRPATPPTTHSTGQSAAKTDSTGAKTSAKGPSSPVPIEQLGKKESAAPVLKKQQASPPPPLDLASLENRLKETKAIGLFSKIALKNQVDDLLDQFREYYQGSVKTNLAELRQQYDLLLLKVLSLLQDGDQPLATSIGASREAIWGILADRQKFATIVI